MSDRPLRDELEQLQVQARTLEAELLVEHPATFLAQREEATQRLGTIRSSLDELERALISTTTDERAARVEVERLAAELHTVEQRRLSVLPFVLLPATFALAGVLLYAGLPTAPAGFLSALGLGYLFGPRILDWAQPGRREPLAPNLKRGFVDEVARSQGPLALGLALVTTVVAAVCGTVIGVELNRGHGFMSPEAHFLLSVPVEFFGAVTVWIAMGARRRAVLAGARKWMSLVAAGLGMFSLAAIALSWLPDGFKRLEDSAYPLTTLPLLLPLGLGVLVQDSPEKRRPWLLIPALGFTAISVWISQWVGLPITGLRTVAEMWLSFQLGVGGLVLAWEFARREKRAWRWLAPAISLIAVGVELWWWSGR